MCDRTQLVPTRQVLQVGDASTINRGRSDWALKASRSCSTLLMSVSSLECEVADGADAGGRPFPLPASLDPQPAAPMATIVANSAANRRLIDPPASRSGHCG